MREYPWWESFENIALFEKRVKEWVLLIPDLPTKDVRKLLSRLCDPKHRVPYRLLSEALDRQNVSEKDTERSFHHALQTYYSVTSVMSVLALSRKLSFESLMLIIEKFSHDDDVLAHAIGNLVGRALAKDKRAKAALKKIYNGQTLDLHTKAYIKDSMNW